VAPTADEAVLTKTFNGVFTNYPHQVLNDRAFVAELTAFLNEKRAQLEGEMFAENELERAQAEVAGKSGAATRPRVTPTGRTDHSESAYYKLTKAQKNAAYSAKFQALQAIKRAKAARPF
jgi:hypothetical protein